MMIDHMDYRAKPSTAKQLLRRAVIGVAMLGFVGAVVWGGINLSHGTAGPKRQVARIMILPDTPPPPPPPEEKKPPPKEEQLRQQVQAPRQETPPEPQQLKMEGQAGDGPSAFASGEVKQDYIGGDIGNGSRYAAYVARLEQMIQDELTRHKLRVTNVKLFLWLLPDGSVQRVNVAGGDGEAERSVRLALADLSRVDEAPLADMPMPVGLQISVR
jgi:periplasmic protein TonB